MSTHSDTMELMLRTIIDISRDNAMFEADILSLEERVRTLSSEDKAVRLRKLEDKLLSIQKTFGEVMENPDRKIPMIKLHRAIFNTGLRESKLAVEGSALWNRRKKEIEKKKEGNENNSDAEWENFGHPLRDTPDEPQRKW